MAIKVYGSSDDLIEVEGDIREEFTAMPGDDGEDDGGILAFSDGTVLRVSYTNDGVWRISPLSRGASFSGVSPAVGEDDDNYSDVATLDGSVHWVVLGTQFVKKAS